MEYVTCSFSEQFKIEWEWHHHIIGDDKIIKYVESTEVIEYITANKNKLTEELYALAKTIYLTSENTHFAYAMEKYNYKSIHEQIPHINNKYILLTINKIINELLSIGVVYWDIHSKNFLIKGKKIVALDLDDAKLGVTPERMLNARFNYIDLVFHLYVGYLLNKRISYLDFFLDNFEIENYFSKDTSDYLKDIYYYFGEQINRDPSFLIPEFEDKERCDYFKSQVLELIK